MATDNTSQINTFTKGMNTDISYSMLQDGQYSYAKNIRITSLNQNSDGELTNGQGAVRPIEGITIRGSYSDVERILATDSIRDIGVIVYVGKDGFWKVGAFLNRLSQDGAVELIERYNLSKDLFRTQRFSKHFLFFSSFLDEKYIFVQAFQIVLDYIGYYLILDFFFLLFHNYMEINFVQ